MGEGQGIPPARFSKHGPELGKSEPPQGDKDSWAKLTKALADESKGLEEVAVGEDRETLAAHAKNIGASCKARHSVHPPRVIPRGQPRLSIP